MNISTRYAELHDLPFVFIHYIDALQEINEEYDEERAFDYMVKCWSKAPCILLEKDDNIIGFAGLNTFAPAYNNVVYLSDYMFYICPEHRGLTAWRVLCKGVFDVSDKFNLKFVAEYRMTGQLKHHERLVRIAGAKPFAMRCIYFKDMENNRQGEAA